MARQLRIEYEGAWYHIMNRGAARQVVYFTDEHREIFLQLLLEIHRRFQIETHAYCLMGNHYHLLIRTPLANLSKAMRHLNSLYVRRFNKVLKRDGPLFRNRFKSIIVDSENYLLRVSRYIKLITPRLAAGTLRNGDSQGEQANAPLESPSARIYFAQAKYNQGKNTPGLAPGIFIHLNPVKAGLVKKAEMYPWCSYKYYINPKKAPDWLFCDETLSRFSQRSRCKQYQLFVEEGVDNETDAFYKKVERLPILGAEAFTKTISEKYLKDKPNDAEVPQQNHILHRHLPSVEVVFQAVADSFELDIGQLQKVLCRKKNIARSMAIYLSMDYAQASQKDVANFLGDISYSAIAKSYTRFRTIIDEDKGLAGRASLILKSLQGKSL